MKRALISGVCGFIASRLAKRLTALNYDVVGIDDLSAGSLLNIKEIKSPNFSFFQINILNRDELSQLFQKNPVDCVFHLAALPRIGYSFYEPEQTYKVNVIGTKNIVDISIENNVKKFVFSSSSSIYGKQAGDAKFFEELELAPISPLANQKIAAEEYIRQSCIGRDISAVILRFFNVYGFSYLPFNIFSTLIPNLLSALTAGKPPTIFNDGLQERDFTYIDDVIDAMVQTLALPCGCETINLGTGKKFSVNYVYEAICKELKKEAAPNYKPLSYQEPHFTCADNAKAARLLNWQPKYSFEQGLKRTIYDYQNREKIVLAMPLHNAGDTVRRAVLSIVNQRDVQRNLILVIGDDRSEDNWKDEIKDLISDKIVIINIVEGGRGYKARRELYGHILNNFQNVAYIGRLDADDELADDLVISKLEKIMDLESPDVIVAGNYQRKDGAVIAKNMPDKNLLEPDQMLKRLRRMSLCIHEAELPSCNLLIKPECMIDYPCKESADDHWYMVELLLKSDKLKIHIADKLVYAIYSLSGKITKASKDNHNFFHVRKELYEYAKEQVRKNIHRNEEALLQRYKKGEYRYLGEGMEGAVYTDEDKVYKVYYALSEEKCIKLKTYMPRFQNAVHFYKIDDIVKIAGKYIFIYPYEKSEPIKELKEEMLVSFLAEAWRLKVIFMSIKPENLICVNGILKIIDYEIAQYTDNLFLNLCVRAFVYLKYYGGDRKLVDKIARSAINRFDLPELDGVQEFVNKVFSEIIFCESRAAAGSFNYQLNQDGSAVEIPFNELGNLEQLFYTYLSKGRYIEKIEIKGIELNDKNYFEPSRAKIHYREVIPFRKTVSLIIKTCPQDYETIYANVKHIIKQLSSPDTFLEKIIAIDSKEKDFTREFTSKGTLASLLEQVQHLIEEKVVDRYIIMPIEETAAINNRWFGISAAASHTVIGVPLTPQLFAFEQAIGEYIFQMDSDVIIVRKDLSHSFLEDMVSEMEKNEKVVSVGFNICQYSDIKYKPYFGFEDGGFVPEVRMGLFHKERFFSLRPFYNALDSSGKWRLTWYRTMHQKQKETGFCSIRGGDSRSFFIHPQNYRKKKSDIWTTILDRAESGHIPHCQQNEFDCAGSYYDWTIPKRNEELVVICLLRNVEYPRFLRMFCSVASQTYEDWGMIIIDDNSDNGLPLFIDNIIQGWSHKITFVKNRVWHGGMANLYKAIHYFASNPESIIVTVDGDDALIGSTVFEAIVKAYRGRSADAVIGRVYQTFRLQPHYRYPVNFINPRDKEKDSNVWQHIRSFKKYLFDSLEIPDLKSENNTDEADIKKFPSARWMEECTDYAMMIPIVEMSVNPLQLDYFTYYYERLVYSPSQKAKKEECIVEILNKKPKDNFNVIKKHKFFIPNLNKIEIDITYECNLKCAACNRSCTQMPTDERIEFSDIKRFVYESVQLDKKWELINILGGEPTLHPDFEQIIRFIYEEYILSHSPFTILQIVSNGFTAQTRELLERIKNKNIVIDYNSFKTNNQIEYFSPFNDAPIDDENFRDADYIQGCWVTSYCGIGLNSYGYYACSVCGGIDRILNDHRGGIKHLEQINIETLQRHFIKFCRYCGNFKDYALNNGDLIPRSEKAPFKNVVSVSWKKLYHI